MSGRIAEAAIVSALALALTLVVAAPVLRAPSERIFGMAIVGRHHDPFTVMRQFEAPIAIGPYSQPLTDIPGALLARLSGAVAAYNWLVLATFPLTALTAYALARYLGLTQPGAALAAFAFAFSPFHLAHSAYLRPHIAQTQWLPLYFLALLLCLDRASAAAVAFLTLAVGAVTLSNFYGGLIAAILTPVAVVSYWCLAPANGRRSWRRLAVTLACLVTAAAVGLVYVWVRRACRLTRSPTPSRLPPAIASVAGAKWWSYLCSAG